jgi:hypothetical protein
MKQWFYVNNDLSQRRDIKVVIYPILLWTKEA